MQEEEKSNHDFHYLPCVRVGGGINFLLFFQLFKSHVLCISYSFTFIMNKLLIFFVVVVGHLCHLLLVISVIDWSQHYR